MSSINILHFVLFSNGKEYDEMYKITRKYYNTFSNIKTIYYKYDDKINEDCIMDYENDMFLIKGVETYLPGILEKTITTFKYFKEIIKFNKYDYIIRSNTSTIIDMDNFMYELERKPVEYGGGRIGHLYHYDVKGGIKDNRWWGTDYPSGSCLIFSRNTFLKMMDKIELIDKTIIDDVAIAILFREHIKDIKPIDLKTNYYIDIPNMNGNIESMRIYLYQTPNIIYYRNKNGSRETDVIQMEQIVDFLFEKKKIK